MPTIDGVIYGVQIATEVQSKLLQKYAENKASASKLHEENSMILAALNQELTGQCVVVKGELEARTYLIGQPKGKYVVYDQLGMVHDAKTTKGDLASIQEIVLE